jgi:transcriptional regulator with XRE-family HTH domain
MITPLLEHRKNKLKLRGRHVALDIGIDPSHYRRIEIGEVKASPEVANLIAKHFGNAITRDQILFPADYATDPPASRARKAS